MANFGTSFSAQFGVPSTWLSQNTVFNPTLDVDSPLFIDPFLLPESQHKEFRECAFEAYERHFTTIFNLVKLSTSEGDKPWKQALSMFMFREARGFSGTCLGYAKNSTRGSAFGPKKALQSLRWTKEVHDLGVRDPEALSALPLFEEGIGADLISDMVVSISIDCIIKFNTRIFAKIESDTGIKIPTKEFELGSHKVLLPQNPCSNSTLPVILVADDVLRHLPVFDNPASVPSFLETNADLRARVNKHLGELAKAKNKKDKEAIRKRAMESAQAFQAFLDVLKKIETTGYDVKKDPAGLLAWRDHGHDLAAFHPLTLQDDKTLNELERINNVVAQIVNRFADLIEKNRVNKLFFVDGEPRHESFAQLLFLVLAKSYCDANNLDIAPESDGGAGPVDFKLSRGTTNVVVEIKLSTNQNVVKGYEKQLDAYMKAESSKAGHYVVIDVGRMGKKANRLLDFAKANPNYRNIRPIHLVDGTLKPSASKI